MRRILITTAIACALGLVLPASGMAANDQIRWNDDMTITEIGKLKNVDTRIIRLEHLRRAFGKPAIVRRGKEACLVRWRRLGLVAMLATFGVSNRSCGRRSGKVLQRVSLVGPRAHRWLVQGALRTGMSFDNLWGAFPDAYSDSVYDDDAIVLADTPAPYVDSGYIPLAWAIVNADGIVRKVGLWIGQAGD